MTQAFIDAKLQRIIAGRCAGKITSQECIKEMRLWRAMLPPKQKQLPQARPYIRPAGIQSRPVLVWGRRPLSPGQMDGTTTVKMIKKEQKSD